MESMTATNHHPQYHALIQETRHTVDTNCAVYHLGRRPQTLRAWACYEDGPLRPLRIYGRLAWLVDDLRRLNGLPSAAGGSGPSGLRGLTASHGPLALSPRDRHLVGRGVWG